MHSDDDVRPNRLREYRLRYELTEEQVAEQVIRLAEIHGISSVGINASTVSRHETGRQRPRPHYRRLYCLLYDTTEAELQLRPALPREAADVQPDGPTASALLDTTWDQAGTVEMATVLGRRKAVDRRAFLLLTGASLTAPAHQWLIQEPGALESALGGDTVTPELADRLPPMIAELRRMEDAQGGGLVLSLAEHEFSWVAELLDKATYTEQTARKLHTSLAELGQCAGFAAYDAGRQALAQRYWVTALHAAKTAGDQPLGAYILGFMSLQAEKLGQPREAAALVDSAIRGAGDQATPSLFAFLHGMQAIAHGASGDAASSDRAITRARHQADLMGTGDEPPWMYWMSRQEVCADSGIALLALGRAERPEPLLSEGIAMLDASLVRDRQLYLTYLADCFLQQDGGRDVDAATGTANEALDLAAGMSSARGTQRIRQVCEQMKPLRRQPAVRELLDRAKSLLPAA